jgi:hypothetical protein
MSAAERLKELTTLWHLWRSGLQEELGEIPTGLEEAVRGEATSALLAARERIAAALGACEESLKAFGLCENRSLAA